MSCILYSILYPVSWILISCIQYPKCSNLDTGLGPPDRRFTLHWRPTLDPGTTLIINHKYYRFAAAPKPRQSPKEHPTKPLKPPKTLPKSSQKVTKFRKFSEIHDFHDLCTPLMRNHCFCMPNDPKILSKSPPEQSINYTPASSLQKAFQMTLQVTPRLQKATPETPQIHPKSPWRPSSESI